MSTPLLYWRWIALGTSLISVVPVVSEGGETSPGLDREGIIPETPSPNFTWDLTGLVPFRDVAWGRTEFHSALVDAMSNCVEQRASETPLGPLSWIEDPSHTTTISGAETAGDDVVVAVASLAALSLAVDDYVLFADVTNKAASLSQVTATDTNEITVDNLAEDMASGISVYKVFLAYPDTKFVSCDPGSPPEQTNDRYRFSTTWRFVGGTRPVRSAAA